MEHLNVLARLDATAFIPRCAEPGTARTIGVEKQVAILAKMLLLVIERDIDSMGGKARVDRLRAGCQDGVDRATPHGECSQATEMQVYKARIARFINKDIEDWSTADHDAALSTESNWHEPPEIDELLQ